jgi:hypothetical protein
MQYGGQGGEGLTGKWLSSATWFSRRGAVARRQTQGRGSRFRGHRALWCHGGAWGGDSMVVLWSEVVVPDEVLTTVEGGWHNFIIIL